MDLRSVENLISVALDVGVTTIDTAPIYVNSEVRIGEFLRKNKRGDLKISTKVGIPAVFNLDAQKLSPKTINSSVETSLIRLGIETIDTLFLHSVDSDYLSDEILSALLKLKQSGKVRKIGYAGDGLHMDVALKFADLEILMLSLNPLDQRNMPYVKTKSLDKKIIVKRSLGSAVWLLKDYPIASHARDILAQYEFFDIKVRKILGAQASRGFTSYQYRFSRMFGELKRDDFTTVFLNFALSVPNIDSVLLGTTSPKNLLRAIEIENQVRRLNKSELAEIESSFSSLANESWGPWT